jgi:uncharacterized protein YqeY
MVTIKEQIIKDLLEARKNGEQQIASLLRTILGEFERLSSKEVTDEQAIKVLQKVEKNLNEVLKYGDDIAQIEAKFELSVLSNYLPKKMDIREMAGLFAMMPADMNIGDWMKALKAYAQDNNVTYDGKDAKVVFETFED